MKTYSLKTSPILLGLLMAGLFAMTACGKTKKPTKTEADEGKSEKLEIKLSPLEESTAFPGAKLEVSAIKVEKDKDKTFNLKVDYALENFTLTEGTDDAKSHSMANSHQGQHIHFILDNTPYLALYTPEKAVKIEKGEHYLLSFLSRSYHESIKNPEAAVLKHFEITEAGEYKELPAVETPSLFYSRPKGEYKAAETKSVLLDFYIFNVELGKDAYTINAKINDQEFTIDKWQPYSIEGLPLGESNITLTLIDKEGKPVDGLLGSVTRKITLSE